MSNRWQKVAAVGFLLFLGLWVAGICRSYTLPPEELPLVQVPILSSVEDYRSNSNLRLANNLPQIGLTQTPLPQVLDQEDVNQIKVYEKTGNLSAGSTAFGDDETLVRQAIANHKAVVFHEKATGIGPRRVLSLGISVAPERFDTLFQELSQVGQLASVNVQHQDRTGEFRRLHAQRQSLKKHQEAILKLRQTEKLSVEDALRVEQKILDIEKEIQSLGVQLGDLLDKAPAYNLFVTLQEYQPGSRLDRTPTLMKRLGNAFLWALGWWLVSILGLGLLAATFVSVQVLRPVRGTTGSAARVAPG